MKFCRGWWYRRFHRRFHRVYSRDVFFVLRRAALMTKAGVLWKYGTATTTQWHTYSLVPQRGGGGCDGFKFVAAVLIGAAAPRKTVFGNNRPSEARVRRSQVLAAPALLSAMFLNT